MAKTVLEFERPIIELEEKIEEMRRVIDDLELGDEIDALEKRVNELRASVYGNLTRWQKVQLARHPDRPYTATITPAWAASRGWKTSRS
jgi:acetyl-CoA carboxylase carboxyl transferase subunit alpha